MVVEAKWYLVETEDTIQGGCYAPRGMSCCPSMTDGFPTPDRNRIRLGFKQLDACIAECKKRDGYDGVTVEDYYAKTGVCWCIKGVKGQKELKGWKSCYIQSAPPLSSLTVSSTGPAATVQSSRMGVYLLTDQTLNNFPVYKKAG